MCRSRASSGMKISELSKHLKGQLGPRATDVAFLDQRGSFRNWKLWWWLPVLSRQSLATEKIQIGRERWTFDDFPWIFRCLFYTCVFDLSQKISSRICLILKNAFFVFCELTVLYFQNYFWPHTISPDYSFRTQKHKNTNFSLVLANKFCFKVLI